MDKALLSICIPTNGRIEILKRTIDSIYKGANLSFDEFEIILSDNSSDDQLPLLIKENYNKYTNIKYFRSEAIGFLNSLNSLQMASGEFLKLHNNYTEINPNGLRELVDFVKSNIVSKPLTFFTNGELNTYDAKHFDNFDDFSKALSYWNSWSTGFSIWKEDFDKVSLMDLNPMFPHTALLLRQHYKKSYIIYDKKMFYNQEVKGKGGYNLFYTFGVEYLRLIESALNGGYISAATFNSIKSKLFYNFLTVWYFNTKIRSNDFTFDLRNIKQSIKTYFNTFGYYKLISLACLVPFRRALRYVVKKII